MSVGNVLMSSASVLQAGALPVGVAPLGFADVLAAVLPVVPVVPAEALPVAMPAIVVGAPMMVDEGEAAVVTEGGDGVVAMADAPPRPEGRVPGREGANSGAVPTRATALPEPTTAMPVPRGKRDDGVPVPLRRRDDDPVAVEAVAEAAVAPVAVAAGPARNAPGDAGMADVAAQAPVKMPATDDDWSSAVDAALRWQPAPAPVLVSWIMAGMPAPVAVPVQDGEGRMVMAVPQPPVLDLDGPAPPGVMAGGWAPAAVPAAAVSGWHDSSRDRADEMAGAENFIPSPRFALAVLDSVSARLPPPMPMEAMIGDRRREAQVAEWDADDGGLQAVAVPAGAMAPRSSGEMVMREAGPLRAALLPAPPVLSPQLGEVRIGLDGGAQDLRVSLSVATGGAAVVADAPRLAADLLANGVRLQSLEVSGGGVAGGGGWSAPSGGEGRPRFVPMPGVAGFVSEQAALPPQRSRAASDRYA